MRLFLALNESKVGEHDDVHRAMFSLKQDNKLDSFNIYSYLAKFAEGLNNNQVVSEIVESARKYKPTSSLGRNSNKIYLKNAKKVYVIKNNKNIRNLLNELS